MSLKHDYPTRAEIAEAWQRQHVKKSRGIVARREDGFVPVVQQYERW